ncbi:MAG: DUF1592 domain-containing protein [Pirellulaceae bacterium]
MSRATWILAAFVAATAVGSADELPARRAMRRLNRIEYENTVRDLLGVRVELKELLPPDGSRDGFDNVGEALQLSSFLLERYLEAADKALRVAIANGPQPARIQRRYSLKESHQVKHTTERVFRTSVDSNRVVAFSSSAWQAVSLTPFYPADGGDYRIRISAAGVQNEGRPMTYRVDAGLMLMTGKPRLVSYFDAPDGASAVAEFVETLEPRHTIRLLPYGLASSQAVHKIGADSYTGPGLAVDWIEVEGPLYDAWPPDSHRRIFGDLPLQPVPDQRQRWEVVSARPLDDGAEILRRFARRAFRRPVTEDAIEPYLSLVAARLAAGHRFEQAVRVGLTAILVSPEFLFLREEPGQLDDFALASRLSYFLWSTMPDDELLTLATQGRLRDTATRREQVERMLKDHRAASFIENFVGQWLGLRDIDFTIPSHLLHPEFDDMLKVSMVREAELFFAEVLSRDLSLTHFVAADFSMLNGRLARHYGIGGVDGWEFRRVTLPADSHRGGVMTMAGVLKVTANGTYTSPVSRGVWVLDRILGAPPEPPVENVAALVPDVRGAATIRDQLEKHRADAACAACHDEIDPPGFALEQFDVIGGWRERYRVTGWRRDAQEVVLNGRKMPYYLAGPVDSAGVLSDGRPFRDIDELKQLLLQNPDQLARALTRRLVTYATGAAPRGREEAAITAIVKAVRDQNYGLRSLVHAVVASDLFLQK